MAPGGTGWPTWSPPAGGVRVQARQYAFQPFIAMGHVRHDKPAHGPTAAQLLHQAACKLGRDPGARGQHAM
eukprot:5301196-Lingulodinium_polyedra.AAC.1